MELNPNTKGKRMNSIMPMLGNISEQRMKKPNLVSHSAANSSLPSKCSPFKVVTQNNNILKIHILLHL